MLLKFGSVVALPDTFKIAFENPKMVGLPNQGVLLDVTINRFDLSSSMILAFLQSGKGALAKWYRKGNCRLRQI